MKSTGLFGKNSGRVGGVVYSNYRGEQIVKAYQPKVKNPNTKGQIEQRAKFKLVSQVGASLSKEIAMSFVPNVAKESPRNAFIKAMLKKTMYSLNKASLPIEEIVLTNSRVQGFEPLVIATPDRIEGTASTNFKLGDRVRIVFIGYNDGAEIMPFATIETEFLVQDDDAVGFQVEVPGIASAFSNVRALVYAYAVDSSSGTAYEDYEVLANDATLADVLKVYAGRVNFSETRNILVPQNV
jgi:hypothetical protein